VCITHPVHPLRGRHVSVRQALREGCDLYYLVEYPDGQAQRIPRAWTDQAITEPATPGTRFTPRQLLTLRRWLDDHFQKALLDETEEIESPGRKENLSGGDDERKQDLCQRAEALVSSAADSEATTPGHAGEVGAATLESAGAKGSHSCQWEGGSP
jgi:hypothetical protein